MIDYQVLSTGSAGNAVIINRAVMIDCGVPFRAVASALRDIRLVLLTHIHGDHFRASTLKKISEERPTVRFGACEWLIKPLADAGIPTRQIDLLKVGYQYDYGICRVLPVPLAHDVPNCGYKVHWPGGRMIYATDTVNMHGITAKDYDLYMIEANYEEEEIRQRIADKKANGQYIYEKRVLKTHLSKAKCDDWIYQNAGPMSEIMYLHGHREEAAEHDARETETAV